MADRHQIFTAVDNGDVNYINQLPQNSPELNLTDSEGRTPLIDALTRLCSTCQKKYSDVTKMLINKGCDVNIQDRYEQTALHAATLGYTDLVQLLLDHDAECNKTDESGRTPLLLAVKNDDVDVAKMLINKGCGVNIQYEYGQTTLHTAARHGFIEIAEMLINRGCDVNIQDEDGQTALHIAARRGFTEIVKLLIDHKADLHVADSHMQTPLMYAVQAGDIAVVQMLIDAKSDVNALDKNNKTVLGQSTGYYCYYLRFCGNYKRYFPIIKLLLNSGADPNIGDSTIENILTCNFSYETVRLLIIMLLHGFNRDMYPIIHSFLTDEELVITPETLKLMDFICLIGACPQSRLFLLYKDLDTTEILKDVPSKREWLENKISVPMSLLDITRITIFKNLRPNKLKNVEKLSIPIKLNRFIKFEDYVDLDDSDDDALR